jgi:predicted DsbA family dithiol-disulfide isomerase
VTIDYVSDISCPWCAIGLEELRQALASVGDLIDAEIAFQPFELNPDMAREGENVVAHIVAKLGSTPQKVAETRRMIQERAAETGFVMAIAEDARIYNTFDAHRLLHWAGLQGLQLPLKVALFKAYFTNGRDPSNPDVLAEVASDAGLDPLSARSVIASNRYSEEVREAEQFWRLQGITGVPATIIDRRYLISGAQPAAAIEKALRKIAAEA